MGANQSSDDPETNRSRLKLEEENKLLREKIKNQQLANKLKVLQNLMEKQRMDSVISGKSPNQLLTNPQLQKEFMQNKNMQAQFLEMVKKQKDLDINPEQYQQINQYLTNLNIEENELDSKKPYLYTNEPSSRYKVRPGEERKPDIGVSLGQREKFVRQLKREKQNQEEQMAKERDLRKKQYEAQMYQIEEDNINPYEILEISKTATLNEMKQAYKRKAKVYHPDRLGGNTKQFQLITKAFMILLEKYKKEQADKQFQTLKEESRIGLEKQQNESKRNVKFKKTNMTGNNFNPKKFNKIYDENRLYNPNDEGYKDWMDNSDYESLKVPKLDKNSYNAQNFNQQFQNHKKQFSKEIIKREEPKALPSLRVNCAELGQGTVSDFSGRDSRGKMEYTDYRKAHSETTLIDPDAIDYQEYGCLEDLQKARSKKMYLTQEEMEGIKMNEMLEKQRDEERMMRLNKNDERAFNQFEKVNKMFLT